MNVAFIVTLDLDDLSDLPGVALDVEDDLTKSGFKVKAVTPWARPSLQNVPTQTQQPTTENLI